LKLLYAFTIALFLGACSTLELSVGSTLPDANQTQSITVFALDNYTDTPQAGMRASNLIEGVLLSKGYNVVKSIDLGRKSLNEQLQMAQDNGSKYLLNGGVSEWRYKTGIDGEPAISLQCKLIDVHSKKVIWSATASSNDWGNSSIGTTAQAMIASMFEVR
jgi:TolB-like protein